MKKFFLFFVGMIVSLAVSADEQSRGVLEASTCQVEVGDKTLSGKRRSTICEVSDQQTILALFRSQSIQNSLGNGVVKQSTVEPVSFSLPCRAIIYGVEFQGMSKDPNNCSLEELLVKQKLLPVLRR